ncbi:MAG: DUF397 domain-containing protein [Micromonosporaceae bacterium]
MTERPEWKISSYSAGNGSCVEVRLGADRIDVRNSNNRDGGTVPFTPAEWAAFLDGVKNGEFDLPR